VALHHALMKELNILDEIQDEVSFISLVKSRFMGDLFLSALEEQDAFVPFCPGRTGCFVGEKMEVLPRPPCRSGTVTGR